MLHIKPTLTRMNELFRVVDSKLHWYIDPTHTAPTGHACNIDGSVFGCDWILEQLNQLPTGIHMTTSGTFRARYMHNGKQVHLGYFKSMQAAINAINAVKEAA